MRLLGCTAMAVLVGCSAQTPAESEPTRAQIPPADDPRFLAIETIEPYRPYLERRAAHRTRAEQRAPNEPRQLPALPPRAELVQYSSEGRELRGFWIAPPEKEVPVPLVVYLHNDFALTELSYRNALPLADAGFAVFLPTYRAENGNPGSFELLFGEVDDARAAIGWASQRPNIDASRVYVIGHSIGGGIAALLSLFPEPRVRMTASVGGIYRARTFRFWAERGSTSRLIRFDANDADEVTLRLLGPNVRDMAQPHRAYAGENDEFDVAYARHVETKARRHDAPFELVLVEGGHMSSIDAAVRDFIDLVRRDDAPR